MTSPHYTAKKTWSGRPMVECLGKDKLSHDRAKEIARGMRARDRRVDTYHCPTCGHWHVGGKAPNLKGRTNARPPRLQGDE